MAPEMLETNNELSKDDILDALSSDDKADDKPIELEEESADDSEEEPAEEKDELKLDDEQQEEEEQPKDEDLELVVAPRRKEILEKFPDLFKTFPYLEKAMYREQQYTELIPTIEDAKQLVETANEYNALSEKVLSGSTKELLNSVKESDPQAFGKIVDNYLTDLKATDSNAFTHVIGNVTKNIIIEMDRQANNIATRDEKQGQILKTAALILHQFIFGNEQFVPPQPFAKQDVENPEAKQLAEERKQFAVERLQTTQNELSTRVDNVLTSTINSNIDPTGVMSDYIKRNATRDALNQTKELIAKDTRFRAVMDALWKKVFETNYSSDAVNRVRQTYLSKAKTILPQVIKSTRNEALKGISSRRVSDSEEVKNKKGPLPPGRSATTKSGQSAKEIPRGMKTLDFLMSD